MSKSLNRSTVELVKKILTDSEKSRDNDEFIQALIWDRECNALHINTRKEFINAYYKGRLSDPNGISRARRKLQELYPELRGTKYKDRQGEYQEDAKQKVKKIT